MNKDLLLDGKEYISASRAAEKLGYAQDYIGALIRTKKVPGKMIGRTWYVEIDSLTEHKNNNRQKKQKQSESAPFPQSVEEKKENISLASESLDAITNTFLLKYEEDTRSRLPELSKLKYRHHERSSALINIGIVGAALVVAFFTLSAWVTYLAPDISEKVTIALAEAGQSLEAEPFGISRASSELATAHVAAASFLSSFGEYVSGLFSGVSGNSNEKAKTGNDDAVETNGSQGIVVHQNLSDRDAFTARVKASFSDDVDVTFDEQGDSGVITPTFHDGDDTENYAFVLVPIKPKQ
jgi:hypothetical protein